MKGQRWLIAVDTGGTFTDCWGQAPDGTRSRCKLLSSGRLRTVLAEVPQENVLVLRDKWGTQNDFFRGFTVEAVVDGETWLGTVVAWDSRTGQITLDRPQPMSASAGQVIELFTGEAAPVVGVRLLTGTMWGQKFPAMEFRLSTTRATNALLEGQTARPVLWVTEGFGDLLEIGCQRRPDLFALGHHKRRLPLGPVVEVPERLAATGEVLKPLDEGDMRRAAAEMVAAGHSVAAVALAHSYQNPVHERRLREILLAAGFTSVSLSAELSPLIRLLPRAQTAVVDAALTPVMQAFVESVRSPLGAEEFFCLASSGSLRRPAQFHAKDSLLSGPAGGVAGCAAIARAAQVKRILTLDMGGTSTDVSRWEGDFLYQFEQRVGSASILSPSLKIETVAAGGGSICDVTDEGLTVGPRSAGADPGPACYGKGGPLTLTDVNVLLGRINHQKAAVPLWPDAARQRLAELKRKLAAFGWPVPNSDDELLQGLLDIAVERMAEAVRRISVREGRDPADYALVAFGGAGPQHACAVARRLGVRQILVPQQAGLLSAFGAGQAPLETVEERQILDIFGSSLLAELPKILTIMEDAALARLEGSVITRRLAEVRLKGQDTSLTLNLGDPSALEAQFAQRYRELYGYAVPAGRLLELVSLRIMAATPVEPSAAEVFKAEPRLGPFLEQDGFSTLVVDEGWQAVLGSAGTWSLEQTVASQRLPAAMPQAAAAVEAELFRCRFSGLVEEMGALLQRTAISTNVKERLDFSCALLDAGGRLVMNAPHIPVHLGALGECVRRVAEVLPPEPGDLFVTNDPAFAGSHLPDVTVICPVFADDQTLVGFTANRAHHAEIGGIVPGSMPAFARCLAEEGVVLPPMLLARSGEYFEDRVEALLSQGCHPSRAVADNLADLRAQAAAARHGAEVLQQLCHGHGAAVVRRQLGQILSVSAEAMERKLAAASFSQSAVMELLDDGWKICAAVSREANGALLVDLTGSSPVHPGSRNATLAVVRSATLYVLRLWLAADIPLNEGIMDRVHLRVPPGFLNPQFASDPSRSPAVVAGNVETSQRLVDALIRVFGLEACSQGTMNNVIFGNKAFGHYETICGGAGAGPGYPGASALHTHMTNTAITDIEILERRYPVRIRRFAVRSGSGGVGKWPGGDGVVRDYEFLAPVTLSVLTEHRITPPFGLMGGGPGQCGRQIVVRASGVSEVLPGSATVELTAGDRLVMETPGGGGWGSLVEV